ncbi:MAG TPA: hypothetical protein VNI01_05535 [Elusimicrobiota bacterium]|nr:hypothetical protein [Elusimicrobiota bacterium]
MPFVGSAEISEEPARPAEIAEAPAPRVEIPVLRRDAEDEPRRGGGALSVFEDNAALALLTMVLTTAMVLGLLVLFPSSRGARAEAPTGSIFPSPSGERGADESAAQARVYAESLRKRGRRGS